MKHWTIDGSEFDGTICEYSHKNSYHMMKLSYAVYAGTTDHIGAKEDWHITEKLVEDGGYSIKKFETHSKIYEPNAMIVSDDKHVFLIFRGTEPTSWNQWATDAEIIRRHFCIGKVHKGFAKSVELIWADIMAYLQKIYVGKKNRLFIGGHSLGAGMAQVAAAKLEFEEGLNPTAIYNFGCPRAFNAKGADLYNQRLGTRTYRVVNNNDVVCHLPLKIMGFRHVGQFKYISANAEFKEDPSNWWLLLDGMWGKVKAVSDLNIVDNITDHLPQNYTMVLEEVYLKEKEREHKSYDTR